MAVPEQINNYPVVAYISGQGMEATGVAVVCKPEDQVHQPHLNYVVWRVRRNLAREWIAESGVYDLSYSEALKCLAYRAGITTK